MTKIIVGHALEGLASLPDESVHSIITSSPYYGLRSYDCDDVTWGDGWTGQLGLEPTPEMFVSHLVEIFREARRVLRSDGTMWLNLSDSFAGSNMASGKNSKEGSEKRAGRMFHKDSKLSIGTKPTDLLGIPFLVALALRSDGWYWRSVIPWIKRNSMPESVASRPGVSHEYFLLFSKSRKYYYDVHATTVDLKYPSASGSVFGRIKKHGDRTYSGNEYDASGQGGRYRRTGDWFFDSVDYLIEQEEAYLRHLKAVRDGEGMLDNSALVVNTKGFPGSHFAVFPPDLIDPCIKASTSEKGCCPVCGAPWERVVDKDREVKSLRKADESWNSGTGLLPHAGYRGVLHTSTTGWQPTCECGGDPVPCTVLDPFSGAGSTGVQCEMLGRNYIGLELSEKYAEMSAERIAKLAGVFTETELHKNGNIKKYGLAA